MTCKEVHNYWESEVHARVGLWPDRGELAEHVASCPECNRFIQEQREVVKCLQVVRGSAPAIPASLDRAVIANYRGYVSEHSSLEGTSIISGTNLRTVLAWVAVAFAIIIAYGGMLLFVPHQDVRVDRKDKPQQKISAQIPVTSTEPKVVAQKDTFKAPKRRGNSLKHGDRSASIEMQDDSFPTSFQSLMYCDQISCPGVMDIIRVQLPSPVLGLTPASARVGGLVSADILVGPDGIARGIRVVE